MEKVPKVKEPKLHLVLTLAKSFTCTVNGSDHIRFCMHMVEV